VPVALSTGTCPDNVLAFLNQQYRWCSGTITLLSEKLFWRTKLRLYTRMCHISGFIYYLYTAVFTFVIPALSIAILLFVPRVLQFKNMIFILPIIFYGGVVYPMWHRSPYRLEAWSVRVVAGWAHAFAFWDLARGKRRGWNPSGSSATKQDGRRRFWIGVTVWSAGSTAAWAGLALWRLMTLNPYNMILILILGVFEFVVVSRILIQPRVGTMS
jgi:cellulose synthase (UDP-forming)